MLVCAARAFLPPRPFEVRSKLAEARLKRLGSLLKSIVQLMLAILVVALLLEGGMRLFGIAVAERGPNNRLPLREPVAASIDPWVGQALIPGASGEVVYPAYSGHPERRVRYEISSQRLRDREFEVPKPEGVLRIACLGDSVTYGTGVALEDTFPKQLEKLLAERFPELRIEVLNAGVYAFNTTQQMGWYRLAVASLEPDIVLLTVTLPDASGQNIPPRDAPPSKAASWIVRLGLTSGIWDPAEMSEATPQIRRTMALRRRSRLIDWCAHRLHRALNGHQLELNYRLDWQVGSPGQRMVARALDEYVQFAQRDEFVGLVAMYPHLVGLDGQYPFLEQIEILKELARERELAFHDLLPVLQGFPAASLQVHPHDRHPNAAANRLIAEHLAGVLAPLVELQSSSRK